MKKALRALFTVSREQDHVSTDVSCGSEGTAMYIAPYVFDAPALHGAGLRGHVPDAAWDELIILGVARRFARRQEILRQGDDGRQVFLLLSGAVKVTRGESPHSRSLVAIRGIGDVIGDMAAIDGGRRCATVIALAPVIARVITDRQFRNFIDGPEVARGYREYVTLRQRESDCRMVELATLSVRQRLARVLLWWDRRMEHTPENRSPSLTQQDLADLVGASRNSVIDALRYLRENHIIVTRRGQISVQDAIALIDQGFPDADPPNWVFR